MIRQQTRRLGGLAARVLALALLVITSMGFVAAGSAPGVSAQEDGLTVDPNVEGVLVSDLVIAQDLQVIGEAAFVATETLSYRAEPGLGAAVIDLLPYGTTGVVTDGPVAMDGYSWFEFDVDGYGDAPGWVAGEFLATEEGATDNSGFAIGSEAIVNGADLHLRDTPGLSGATLAALPLGMALTIVDGPVSADGYSWYLVQDAAQTMQGWVAGLFLAASPGVSATFASGDTVMVTGDGLNLRDVPMLSGGVNAQLAVNTVASITAGPVSADGYWWYQIALDGANPAGWVVADFLTYP